MVARQGPATDVFPDTVLGPLEATSGRFAWPVSQSEGVCVVVVRLTGTSIPSGLPVQGEFRMQVGRGPGDAGPQTVADPELAARLIRAIKAGGKGYVTGQDLYRLEQEGALPGGTLAWVQVLRRPRAK